MQTETKNFEVIRKTDDLIYYHLAKETSYAISKTDKQEWEEAMTQKLRSLTEKKVKKIKHIY